MIVGIGQPLSGFWSPGVAGAPPPPGPTITTITGKLTRPILTHYTNITTSWWWLALLSALGGR